MDLDFAALLAELLAKYPLAGTVLVVIGALRLTLKPLISLARTVVAYTPGDSDDKWLDTFENSYIIKTLVYVLDWLGSINIKPVEKK